jgi:hypothetical protein
MVILPFDIQVVKRGVIQSKRLLWAKSKWKLSARMCAAD